MDFYPNLKEKRAIDEAQKLMTETMARYDPSHDAYHVERVRKTAMSLARALASQKPDLLVVELAALLHDVLDKKYAPEAEASDPYTYFKGFFETLSSACDLDLRSDGRARQIVNIIENVSWTTEKQLRKDGQWTKWHDSCVELHCVQDADRLDAIGAFGIMRCAAYSAVVNRPLHAPPGRSDTAIQHFYDKLLHIQDRLKTEPGRKMGRKRHQFMLEFLRSIDEEDGVELSTTEK